MPFVDDIVTWNVQGKKMLYGAQRDNVQRWEGLSDRLLMQVREHLEQWQLVGQRRPPPLIVVAVSGGSDSLCLLHLLWRLRESGKLRLHVAHLDHRFRGEQSAMEARFVAHIAASWDIPATIRAIDVPLLVRTLRANRQATARHVRYAFLAQIARAHRADAVAVAHQADDQAETVLFHLVRGAGTAGLRGMRAVVRWEEWAPGCARPETCGSDPDAEQHAESNTAWSGAKLIRPLLTITRAEIAAYCAIHRLTPQEDPSNASLSYTRNRIRIELLPLLTRFNPKVIAALGRTASVCAEDYEYIQEHLEMLWTHGLVEEYPHVLRFSLPVWRTLHPVLQRYALRRAAQHFTCGTELSYEQAEMARLATARKGTYPFAGSLVLEVTNEALLVTRQETTPDLVKNHHFVTIDPAYADVPQLTGDMLRLSVPGATPFSAHWTIECREQAPNDLPAPEQLGKQGTIPWVGWVALDANSLGVPQTELIVRRRRPGDTFRPVGGPGTKRIQDFFVDRKIPRALREHWPLLATPEHIVWVVGLRADERFVRTPSTTMPLWIVFRRNNL